MKPAARPFPGSLPVLPAGRLAAPALVRYVRDRFLLLPIGAALALVWANVWPESYFRLTQPLAFPVNEIGMALFLGLIAQELLESLMPGGALHTWRRWGVAAAGAVGGMAGAAGLFLLYVSIIRHELVLAPAWPIACAIDVAAGYYVLKLVGMRRPVIALFLFVAFATDAVGLAIVAIRPGEFTPNPAGLLPLLMALGLAAWLRFRNVRRLALYVAIPGTLFWLACYLLDVHPALALLPVVPFLPRERRQQVFEEPADDDDLHHAEHQWGTLVQVILFCFGLVNAGVQIGWYDTGTWGVMLAALVGRPVGLLIGIALALFVGLVAPPRMRARDFVVVALATTSGFTFALFFATSMMAVGPALAQIKLGALITAAGALLAIAVARLVGAGGVMRRAPARGR
jgi:NhaA family Na+:H+ antiporter